MVESCNSHHWTCLLCFLTCSPLRSPLVCNLNVVMMNVCFLKDNLHSCFFFFMHMKDRIAGCVFIPFCINSNHVCVCVHVVVCSAIIGRSTKGFKKYLFNFITAMPIVSFCFLSKSVVIVNSQRSSENFNSLIYEINTKNASP